MSLLGIDVGTSGCKAVVFSEEGRVLGASYTEYDIVRPKPDLMELDSNRVWKSVKETVGRAVSQAGPRSVQALSVASMGEAFVPVSANRHPLGNSILLSDPRGGEYIPALRRELDDLEWYRITGNPMGIQYGLPKLMWIRDHLPDLYRSAYKFLNWGSFVTFMFGAEPAVDYSLANRDLLFDIRAEDWSPRLLAAAGIERSKLPDCVAPGSSLGRIAPGTAEELGLPATTLLVAGAHDQCANALGSGVVSPGEAMYGMGTYSTIVPIYNGLPPAEPMLDFGLNTEHHAIPGRYVSFLYHMGGATIKWYRDTFAAAEHREALARGTDIYESLFDELSEEAGTLLALPHFSAMGPPDYIDDSAGVVLGIRSGTPRREILKALLESNAFALKESVDNLESIGVGIERFIAVGGGSKADATIKMYAGIFDRPFERPVVTEAGALGAAMLAGVSAGVYPDAEAAVARASREGRVFEPDVRAASHYRELYQAYRALSGELTSLARRWVGFLKGRDERG